MGHNTMHLLVIFTLMLGVLSQTAEEKPKTNENTGKGNPLKDAVGFLASPEVTAATQALEAIKNLVSTSKTSQVNIGERQRGVGFERLTIDSFASTTTWARKEPMIGQITKFVNNLPGVLQKLKDEGLEMLKQITDVIDDSKQQIMFTFTSPTVGGQLHVAYFLFGVTPQNYWRCSTFSASGSFKVAPDWYIKTTTKSKKGFFSSSQSTNQEIVFVDRGVTQDDVAQLFLVAIPDMKVVQRLLVSNPASAIGESTEDLAVVDEIVGFAVGDNANELNFVDENVDLAVGEVGNDIVFVDDFLDAAVGEPDSKLPSNNFSESTPGWAIALIALSCVLLLSLVIVAVMLRKLTSYE